MPNEEKVLIGHAHRWTTDELKQLMSLWQSNESADDISALMGHSVHTINRMVGRLRKQGIPLKNHECGARKHRSYHAWSQGECEYLVRRRSDGATTEEIAIELNRTYAAVCGMIQQLRKGDVQLRRLGSGRHAFYDLDVLRLKAEEMNSK